LVSPKLNVADPALRFLLPVRDDVAFAALRTHIADRELPILRGIHDQAPILTSELAETLRV
jgi:hypothetical protein